MFDVTGVAPPEAVHVQVNGALVEISDNKIGWLIQNFGDNCVKLATGIASTAASSRLYQIGEVQILLPSPCVTLK